MLHVQGGIMSHTLNPVDVREIATNAVRLIQFNDDNWEQVYEFVNFEWDEDDKNVGVPDRLVLDAAGHEESLVVEKGQWIVKYSDLIVDVI
jgi:hypothetical protein